MKKSLVYSILILLSWSSFAQTSAIKGTVVDKQSQFPLTGVTVILVGSDPIIGAASDFDGNFRLENVPVGRHTVSFKYIGYKPVTIPNLVVQSGKELDLNIQLEESIEELDEVIVRANDKREALNEMATVSARTFSMEEAGRYSGSLQDPARMAQNYAGVSGSTDDRNDIIIRGNSPLGVLWRMEGVDIPSPNHFSTLGTTGGPISMLNINNLANSDFMTSAWSADYGNALSGVFDLKLRNGNKDKYEHMGQVGFNGFEFGAEGPFKRGGKSSYMANYRYSTLGVLNYLGINLGTGNSVPNYQDLTFKINAPNEKLGTFTLWGIGGFSDIFFEATPEVDSTNLFTPNTQQSDFKSRTFILGGSHLYFFNDNTFSKLAVSTSLSQTEGLIEDIDFDNDTKSLLTNFDRSQFKVTAHYKINKKFNARNNASVGIIADNYFLDMYDSSLVYRADNNIPFDIYKKTTDIKEATTLIQSYINWQHRLNDLITFNTGIHSQHFLLTKTNFVEPRVGIKYQIHPKHTLNIGAGLHSQLQPITLYYIEETTTDNSITYPNQELGFSKALHTVVGHDFSMGNDLRLKTEVYYQYIYEIPIDDNTSTSFSMINEGADFTLPNGTGYINSGDGYNYGVELTLEKFYNKGYYFLFTTSLFESKYRGSDGVLRNTKFNGNYVVNALGGKEFKLSSSAMLSFDTKITNSGGRRYTPINFEESALQQKEIRFTDRAFEEQYDPYFRADFKVTFTLNSKKISQKWALDIQNITNQQNVFITQYDVTTNQLQTQYQRGFFPMMLYQIYF